MKTGSPPDVDHELVQDHRRPGLGIGNNPRLIYRLHLDVEIGSKDWTSLQAAMGGRNDATAHSIVVANIPEVRRTPLILGLLLSAFGFKTTTGRKKPKTRRKT